MQMSAVHVLSDYSQETIAYLASYLDKDNVNKPVGFFSAELRYNAVVDEVSDQKPSCKPSYRLKLTLSLDKRVIQVANNLPNPECSAKAVVQHYGKILSADATAVIDQSKEISNELSIRMKVEFEHLGETLTPVQYSEKIVDLARLVVKENTSKMLETRSKARAAARDGDDVQGAVQACGKNI